MHTKVKKIGNKYYPVTGNKVHGRGHADRASAGRQAKKMNVTNVKKGKLKPKK